MAGRLTIDWEPLPAPEVADPEVAATWAALRIAARGSDGREVCLTRVYDQQAHSERDEVYGTVLPLAEWIARCWHHLVHAARAQPGKGAGRSEIYEWQRTHCWRFCGEGSALPDARIYRADGESGEIDWQRSEGGDADQFERVLFRTGGRIALPVDVLAEALEGFVTSVIARLQSQASGGPRGEDLGRWWSAARNPDDPEFVASRLAARLGASYWTLDSAGLARVRSLASAVHDPVTLEALELSNSQNLDDLLGQAHAIWRRCEGESESSSEWREFRGLLATPGGAYAWMPPWQRGWQAARRLREVLGQSPADRFSYGGNGLPLDVVQVDTALQGSRSVIAWDGGRRPVVASPAKPPGPAGEFARVRDLYPLLFEGEVDKPYGCVISERVARVFSVANAFAAELVAPVDRLRSRLQGRSLVDWQDIEEIASELRAPATCVRHQVENHLLAQVRE